VNKYSSFYEGNSSVWHDSSILEHYGLNELNFESIKNYREKFAAVKPNHPWNGLETKEFLYKIGAWGKLRDSSKEGVTLAGLLMFSEERVITEVLPQYFLEYRESLDGIVTNDWIKRFTSQDGTWSGNLYDFYFKVMSQLQKHNLARSVQTALREALVNAIVHADYLGEGGIIVEKENGVFRFANPGLFRIPIDSALSGHMSNLRNPNLFKMFILIGLCKRAGFGLKHIVATWSDPQCKQPEFIQHSNPERTVVILYPFDFPDETAVSYETDIYQDIEQHDNGKIDLTLTEEDANSVNKQSISINSEDSSINSEENSVNKQANSLNNRPISINSGVYSVNIEGNYVNNDLNSVNKHLNSVNNEPSSSDPDKEKSEIDEKLWNIAELARKKKRLPPSVMENIILQLCAQRPLMLKELAALLERTPDGLRNNYLGKLIEEGKIRLKYPDQPNHPKQAYMKATE
jgi:ATP-dependent DNA helicase RecG